MSNLFFKFINLHNGEESKDKVLENIKSGISFRGSNLWILACAIIIASVGLNVNSTAVIIGAMLISPLMGPIVGTGFALAMYDFELLKKSGKNLLIATIVSLVVATIYFWISPFKETQSELLARTSPTIYDVLIAFFGGLVGVIALTRVEKGNPIPGVAIATALMPPLCTAGYGLAIGNVSYFLGAFYLYSINCFFICIATFLILKYLNYKPVQRVHTKIEKRIRYGITALIVVMIVPSFYLAYSLFQEKKFNQKVEDFIRKEFTANDYALIYKDIQYNGKKNKIKLAFLTKKFKKEELENLNKELLSYGIYNTKLHIRQNNDDLKGEILSELGIQNKSISEKDITINNLKKELMSYKFDDPKLFKELSLLFPELENVSVGRQIVNQQDSLKSSITLLYELPQNAKQIDTQKLQDWLALKFNSDDVKILQVSE